MAIMYPLTATALGRSPYDEAVEGTGSEDPRHPPQQYDERGRPVNLESKRINRQIVRSHNEVMSVVGVAEPEDPFNDPEIDSARRHYAYEENIGEHIYYHAQRCMEMIAIMGTTGLQQRVMIYRQFSQIPFWHVWREKNRISWGKSTCSSAVANLFTNYVGRNWSRLWTPQEDRTKMSRLILCTWWYFRMHINYFSCMQRLGLISLGQWLPHPSCFIPFTEYSPIPPPPPPDGFDALSLLRWTGQLVTSATPFFLWISVSSFGRTLYLETWSQIFNRLPCGAFVGHSLLPPAEQSSVPPADPSSNQPVGRSLIPPARRPSFFEDREDVTIQIADETTLEMPPNADQDIVVMEDDLAEHDDHLANMLPNQEDASSTDEDENDRVNTTLISFDVEDTEASTDAPPGTVWSAELRPSQTPEGTTHSPFVTTYYDTPLKQFPALLATCVFTDSAIRLAMSILNTAMLRLMARRQRLRYGLPCHDIYSLSILNGLSWCAVANYFGVELLHFALSGQIWATASFFAEYFHVTDKEWKQMEAKKLQ